MAKGKIGFVQETPMDEARVKYSWDRKIGNVTVTYSTEGEIGVVFYHNCRIARQNPTTGFTGGPGFTAIQSTEQLTREEVERRFAKDVSEFISGLGCVDGEALP